MHRSLSAMVIALVVGTILNLVFRNGRAARQPQLVPVGARIEPRPAGGDRRHSEPASPGHDGRLDRVAGRLSAGGPHPRPRHLRIHRGRRRLLSCRGVECVPDLYFRRARRAAAPSWPCAVRPGRRSSTASACDSSSVWIVSSAVPMAGLLAINFGRHIGLIPTPIGKVDWDRRHCDDRRPLARESFSSSAVCRSSSTSWPRRWTRSAAAI